MGQGTAGIRPARRSPLASFGPLLFLASVSLCACVPVFVCTHYSASFNHMPFFSSSSCLVSSLR